MKNLISIIAAVAVGVWAYFGIVETLNKHSTTLELMQKDLEANSEFRIKYPRGELGQSSGEAELFMLVEHMSGLIEQMEEELKGMRNNKVNIDFLKLKHGTASYPAGVPITKEHLYARKISKKSVLYKFE